MRAKKFYNLLKEEHDDSVLTVCFDLMQNQPLPRSPIGEAYCSRQLWQFFLACLFTNLENKTQMMCHFILGVSTRKAKEQTLLQAHSPTLLKIDWPFPITTLNLFVCIVTLASAKIKILLFSCFAHAGCEV